MHRKSSLTLALATSFALSGCMSPRANTCPNGTEPMRTEHLYFGTATAGAAVTPQQWQSFLADTVTPKFPDGFTTWAASGQWRARSGQMVHEDSYFLNVVHSGGDTPERSLGEIISAYKLRFQQQSVLRVHGPVCAGF